jgi:hypothetical protein
MRCCPMCGARYGKGVKCSEIGIEACSPACLNLLFAQDVAGTTEEIEEKGVQ